MMSGDEAAKTRQGYFLGGPFSFSFNVKGVGNTRTRQEQDNNARRRRGLERLYIHRTKHAQRLHEMQDRNIDVSGIFSSMGPSNAVVGRLKDFGDGGLKEVPNVILLLKGGLAV